MMGEDGQANECIMNELVWSGLVRSGRSVAGDPGRATQSPC